MLSFSIKVGWIFTDLVSEDTRKGTVRYSRNKVRRRQECCLARDLIKVELTWISLSLHSLPVTLKTLFLVEAQPVDSAPQSRSHSPALAALWEWVTPGFLI